MSQTVVKRRQSHVRLPSDRIFSWGNHTHGPRTGGRWPLARWLAAEPRDVIGFERRQAPAAGGRAAHGAGAADLQQGLSAWRQEIRRGRAVALVRRWSLMAGLLALLLALLSRVSSSLPLWVVAAAPLLFLAMVVALLARQTLSPSGVARLLDRRLGLKDQVASAVEVARQAGAAESPLGRRLDARATALVAEARGAWTVQALPHSREWAASAALLGLVVLALLVPRPVGRLAGPAARQPGLVGAPALLAGAPPLAAVPTLSPQAHLSVQVSVAVVNRPPAPVAALSRQALRAVQGHRAGSARGGAGKAPGGGAGQGAAGASSRGGNAAPAGRPALHGSAAAPAGAGHAQAPAAKSGRQAPALPQLSGSRLSIPQRGGARAGAAGAAHATAGRTAGARAQQGQGKPRTGAGTSTSTAAPGRGVARAGQLHAPTRSMYGGAMPNPRQLPKPGLITAKGSFSGLGTPGGGSAGHSRGSRGSTLPGRPTAAGAGRQLSLRSAYGGAPNRAGQRGNSSTPGHGGAPGSAAGGPGGPGGPPDYIPPDANTVAPGGRLVVSGYFTPPPTR